MVQSGQFKAHRPPPTLFRHLQSWLLPIIPGVGGGWLDGWMRFKP